jgi:zinc protease
MTPVAAVRMLLVGVLVLGLGLGAPSSAPIAHREVLPNGMVLLVAERPDVPIVAVRVYHRAGAVHDPPGQAGLANLTGATLTRGTAGRTGREIDAAIEFVGGRLEAGAGRDGLTVSLAVLRRDLALGLDLVRDVVLTPSFPDDEVKRKAAEIQAAIQRSEDNPGHVASRALARLVFPGHPYGQPVEGTRESVGRLQRQDVVRFHRDHVRPDATLIAVVGAVGVDEARREVLARFGAWPQPAPPPARVPEAPASAPPRVERVARPLTQATILLGRPAVNQRDPDYFALSVATYIAGGGSASRLYVKVREEAGLAYAVGSYVSPAKHGASVAVSAQTRTAEAGQVVDMARKELARLGRERVSDRELDLAKSYLIGSFPLRLDTSSKVADFLVGIEELGLGLDYADRYRERIARVTAEDVQRVAARLLAPDTMSQVVVGAP